MGGNVAILRVMVEDDYNPETDGYHLHLTSFVNSLSLPQDNNGDDDISTLVMSFQEACNADALKPGTVYIVRMVECIESDGHPHYMQTWGVEFVDEYPINHPTPATAG
jgi:hypothetical protein